MKQFGDLPLRSTSLSSIFRKHVHGLDGGKRFDSGLVLGRGWRPGVRRDEHLDG